MLLKVVRRSAFFVCAVALVFSFIGCDNGSGSSGPTIETIRWAQDSDGFYHFETNDEQYYNYWFAKIPTTNTEDGIKEIKIKKNSGANVGYGMVYEWKDKKNFHRVLISLNGLNRVDVYDENETEGKVYEKDWTFSNDLKTGLGEINKLTVNETGSDSGYEVYINDALVERYNATHSYTDAEDSIGAIVYIGKETSENFPDTPVDVRFRRTQPSEAP